MLNRAVLMEQLQALSNTLFQDNSAIYIKAYESWMRILADPLFKEKTKQAQLPWLIPDWFDTLDGITPIPPLQNPYAVLAVDGSQVYPDRHQGTSCFLVNIGSTLFCYGIPDAKGVTFESQPFVFSELETSEAIDAEWVNAKRQELELRIGLEKSIAIKKSLAPAMPFVFLFDGSLIFWHLESKEATLKQAFLERYMALLHLLYQESIVCAGYISLPKSKELVNLIKAELCNFNPENTAPLADIDFVVDTTIARFYVQPYTRSIVFKSNASITAQYPPHLAPYFFYMDIGAEIVRLEIPAWIAGNEELLQTLCTITVDQVKKGHGYPVALAESHEQAVIKGPDREFFYHLITKIGLDHKRHISLSQKSMKKRHMGV